MAVYNLRYTGTFKDYFDNDIIIDIKEKDYTGASEEVIFHYPAGSIEYNGDSSDIYNPVISSSLKLQIISQESFKFIDFYSSDSSIFKVFVYRINRGYLLWTGSIIPELFIESYTNPPYPVESVWTDGLKYLNNKKTTLTGLQMHLDILNDILAKTGLDLLLVDCVNIYEESHLQGTNDSPLNQTYVDMQAYKDMNCYEILNDILTIYGSRIYQKAGEWWIVPIHQFATSFTFRRFSGAGVFVNSGTYNPESLIGRTRDNLFCNVNQELSFLPGLKELNIELTQSKRESFILNSDFSEWEKQGSDYLAKYWINSGNDIVLQPVRNTILTDNSVFSLKDFGIKGETNFNYGRNRAGGTTYRVVQLNKQIVDRAKLLFRLNNNSYPNPPIINIFQTIENKIFTSTQKLRFSIKYAITNTTDIGQFWIGIVLSPDYSLRFDGGWSVEPVLINIPNIQGSEDSVNQSTFELISTNIPSDGILTISIYASDKGFLNIFECTGELLKADSKSFEPTIEIKKTINENNNYIPETINLFTGDFYQHENDNKTNPQTFAGNEALSFFGGLYLNNDKRNALVTKQWQIKDLIESNGFGDSLINTIIKQRSLLLRPQWVIDGDILFNSFAPDKALIDYNVNFKKYLICGGSYNLNSCQFSGNFIEVGMFSLAPWILKDGTWNDDGIWIDEDTWNDSEPTTDTISILVNEIPPDRLIDLTSYIDPGDTIETLPETYSVVSDFIRDDDTVITAAPYTVTAAPVFYYISLLKVNSYMATFTATISGTLKTFKIYVYL